MKVKKPRARRGSAALIEQMLQAPTVVSEANEKDYRDGNCIVRSFADDFTDELDGAALLCTSKDAKAAFRLDVIVTQPPTYLNVFDHECEARSGSQLPGTFRVGLGPIYAFIGKWNRE